MTGAAQTAEIAVRHCHGLPEFAECFELQRSVWGKTELDVPLPLFVVAAETGGQVLGAFDRDTMIGFTLAIAGYRDGRPFLHSHMTAVLENYRDRGIGRRLNRIRCHRRREARVPTSRLLPASRYVGDLAWPLFSE
jgi:predicted GNAT superfamily acetyltransferase